MQRYIKIIVLLIVLIVFSARTCYAENVAEESAFLYSGEASEYFDYRVENLRNFLNKYNSPLSPYADLFVASADQYDLDYRLVPAITGVESTFGKHIPENSYNAYGWANGDYSFISWEDSITHVSKILRINYINRGADSIPEIARIYAPPSNTWGRNVSFFINKIDTLPFNFDI